MRPTLVPPASGKLQQAKLLPGSLRFLLPMTTAAPFLKNRMLAPALAALRRLKSAARGCKNQRQRQYNRVLTHAARRTSIDSFLLWKRFVLCWHAKHVRG